MKLTGKAIASFLRAPPPEVAAVLIHGPDRGLVRERAESVTRAVVGAADDPFRAAELTAEQLRDEPSLLADEARALSFGGGRRLVRVRNATDGCAEALRRLLAEHAAAGLALLEAGDLGPRSSLRQLGEKAANAATLACYPDTAESVRQLIGEMLARQRLAIEDDALDLLAGLLGADRGASRGEIEKLCLYKAGSPGAIRLADVAAVVGDASAVTLGSLAFAVADGDQALLDREFATAQAEGGDAVAILRVMAQHLQRLAQVKAWVASGRAPAQALAMLKPRVIFHQEARFRRQLQTWSEAALTAALRAVTEAEIACKSSGAPAALLCHRALMQVAWLAHGRRRP